MLTSAHARAVHVSKHGTRYVGEPVDSSGRVRRDLYVSNANGEFPETVHTTGRDDISDVHTTYPTGYDPKCSWCWLNFSHTVDAHNVRADTR